MFKRGSNLDSTNEINVFFLIFKRYHHNLWSLSVEFCVTNTKSYVSLFGLQNLRMQLLFQ